MRITNRRSGVVVVLMVLLATVTASADAASPATCPDLPLTYAGTDDVVRELRSLREDLRAVCLAARDESDLAHEDAAAVHADGELAHTDALAVVDAIAAAGVPSETATTVALSSADVARSEALVIGLGIVAGLMCVVLLMPAIRRYWT